VWGGKSQPWEAWARQIPANVPRGGLDTHENILVNPAVGLIFMVPGHTETLRVAGNGRIVLDPQVQQRHVINGKPPVLALVVGVTEASTHRSKSFVRSKLWLPEKWPDRPNVPTLADWVVACTVAHEEAGATALSAQNAAAGPNIWARRRHSTAATGRNREDNGR